MSYSVGDIKVAAYRWEELPNMTQPEKELWMGLGYCYEWYRSHPDEKKECDNLAQLYLRMFELNSGRLFQHDI